MQAKDVKLSDLTTWDQCDDAVSRIESEPRNIVGGYRVWTSGHETHLTTTAQRKVDSINRKMDKLIDDDE